MEVSFWVAVAAVVNAIIILAVLFAIFDTAKAAKAAAKDAGNIRAQLQAMAATLTKIEAHAKKTADNSGRPMER